MISHWSRPIKYNIRAKYAKNVANAVVQLPSKMNFKMTFVVINELYGISIQESQ